jgi:hypothetical protein
MRTLQLEYCVGIVYRAKVCIANSTGKVRKTKVSLGKKVSIVTAVKKIG